MAHMPSTDPLDDGVAVVNTRLINTTAPIAGGGDLSADRTITLNDLGVTAAKLAANAVETAKVLDAAVTLAKMANVATTTLIGRVTAGTGVPEALTATQATTILNAFTTSLKGLAPASGGGTDNYLRADGTWAEPPGDTIGWFNVQDADYGATGDGVTDDSAAIRLAIAAAEAAGGGIVYFPTGTYIADQDGGNTWCLNIPSNVTLQGVPQMSVIKAAIGQDAQERLLYTADGENVVIRDLVLDGSWGNAVVYIATASNDTAASSGTYTITGDNSNFPASGTFGLVDHTQRQTITYTGKTTTATGGTFTGCTGGDATLMKKGMKVGYIETQTGINQVTQVDPKNHLIMVRGSRNVLIENCEFKQAYGDFVWLGVGPVSLEPARDIRIIGCRGDITARNGISVGQKTLGVTVENCIFTNVFTQAFDSEPVGFDQGARDILIDRCELHCWWNPYLTFSAVMAIDGGWALGPGLENAASGWRVTNNKLFGSVNIATAQNVVLRGNTIICDGTFTSNAPVFIDHFCDGITVDDNDIYDRSEGHEYQLGAIAVQYYLFGAANLQPAGVRISNNRIRARNGNGGVGVHSAGGFAGGVAGLQAPEDDTATGVTATTLTRAGAGWTVNIHQGWHVRMGTAMASIVSNTSDTLTLTGWFTPAGGDYTPTPAAGTYTIFQISGIVDIINNEIDLADDGHGAGTHGILIAADLSGVRVCARGNHIRNATDWGVLVAAPYSNRPVRHLELSDNTFWDDQATPTFNACIRLPDPCYFDKLILRNNGPAGGTTYPATVVSGVSAATILKNWLINDGSPQQWAGYGTPESVVTAPVGSTYQQLDVGTGSTLWKKDSGVSTTGWINVGETSRPNLIRNSGFWFAQRQAPGTLATYDTATGRAFNADGWAITNENASAQYIRVDALTPAAGLASRFFGSYTKITNTGKLIVSQVIEGTEVAKLRGRNVRLQAKIKGTASQTVRFGLAQLAAAGTVDTIPATFATISNTGSVDHTLGTNLAYITPTASYNDTATISTVALSCAVTTSWQRFGGVFTVPADCKNLVVMFWSNEGLTATNGFSLSEVTLVDGPEIQVWTPGDLTSELERCKRFYQKSFTVDSIPAQNAGVNTGELVSGAWKAGATAAAAIIPWRFSPEMRTAPTIVTYNPAAANAEVRRTGGGADFTAVASGGTTSVQTVITGTGDAGGAVGDAVAIHATGDAEL